MSALKQVPSLLTLTAMKWFFPRLPLSFFSKRCLPEDIYRWLRWLSNLIGDAHRPYPQRRMLKEYCQLGLVERLDWLFDFSRLQTDPYQPWRYEPGYWLGPPISYSGELVIACEYGHLDVVQWLVEKFQLTAQHVRADNNAALHVICNSRPRRREKIDELQYVALAQWLVETFQLTADDARSSGFSGNGCLQLACANDHLELVQWMINTWGASSGSTNPLTVDDVRANNNYCLRRAFIDGSGLVARWLVETFRLTADDARSNGNQMLSYACRHSSRGAVQWMFNTWSDSVTAPQLGAQDIMHDGGSGLQAICGKGNLELLQWLVTRCQLTADHVRSTREHLLHVACWNDRLEVAQWLVSHFQLTSADVEGMITESDFHIPAIAQWLADTFNVSVVSRPTEAPRLSRQVINAFRGADAHHG